MTALAAFHAVGSYAQARESGESGPGESALAPQAASEAAREPSLASEVIDPTVSLLNVHLLYEWTIDRYEPEEAAHAEDDGHALLLRPVIPFTAWGLTNILRLTVPYELDPATGGAGLGATQVFDLVVFEERWGRWGVGPVVNLVPDTEEAEVADPFQVGPALGVVGGIGEWTLGVFNQNFFSANVQLSVLQPIVGYEISPSLSVSTGELELLWNWDSGEFDAVPLGAQLNVVVPVLGQPIRLSANPQLNLVNEPGLERWSAIFGVALLVPKEKNPVDLGER